MEKDLRLFRAIASSNYEERESSKVFLLNQFNILFFNCLLNLLIRSKIQADSFLSQIISIVLLEQSKIIFVHNESSEFNI
jgi:hypothetical protein